MCEPGVCTITHQTNKWPFSLSRVSSSRIHIQFFGFAPLSQSLKEKSSMAARHSNEREGGTTVQVERKIRDNKHDCHPLSAEQEGSIKQSQTVLTMKSSATPLFKDLVENCGLSESSRPGVHLLLCKLYWHSSTQYFLLTGNKKWKLWGFIEKCSDLSSG